MANYVLTEETRKHRLELFKKMLPLLKSTLDDWKQLFKERERLEDYKEHLKETTSTIETMKGFIQSGVFSSNKEEEEILQKRITVLEDESERLKEFISVREKSTYELENKIVYYQKYFQGIAGLIINCSEPILDEKDVDTKYFREYCYLIFVLEVNDYRRSVKKEELLTEQAIKKIEQFLKNTLDFKLIWNSKKTYYTRDFFEIFH